MPVCVVSVHNAEDRLRAQLACIDENLIRSELTELERGEHLARRRELYLQRYPETAPVQERGGPGRGGKTGDNLSPVSTFAADTAAKIGTSERTVQRAVKIGTDLSPEARGYHSRGLLREG